jgi:hypothetical protein
MAGSAYARAGASSSSPGKPPPGFGPHFAPLDQAVAQLERGGPKPGQPHAQVVRNAPPAPNPAVRPPKLPPPPKLTPVQRQAAIDHLVNRSITATPTQGKAIGQALQQLRLSPAERAYVARTSGAKGLAAYQQQHDRGALAAIGNTVVYGLSPVGLEQAAGQAAIDLHRRQYLGAALNAASILPFSRGPRALAEGLHAGIAAEEGGRIAAGLEAGQQSYRAGRGVLGGLGRLGRKGVAKAAPQAEAQVAEQASRIARSAAASVRRAGQNQIALKRERGRLASLENRLETHLNNEAEWRAKVNARQAGVPAVPHAMVRMTDAQAKARLGELDKQYEGTLKTLAPAVDPYTAEMKKAETLSRNTMRGRMAKGMKPSTGRAVEGRVGPGSTRIPTVNQELRDLAESKLHELVEKFPNHPVAQKAAALIAERDQLRNLLNARAEATMAGEKLPELPGRMQPVRSAGGGELIPRHPPEESNPYRNRIVLTQHAIEQTRSNVYQLERQVARDVAKASRPAHVPAAVAELRVGQQTEATGGALGQRVRESMRGVPGLRTLQEQERHAQRVERIARAEQARAGATGLEAHYAAKRQLAGKYAQLEFHGFRDFSNPEWEAAHQHVNDHPSLLPFEKVRVGNALEQVRAGRLPTRSEQALLERTFGKEETSRVLKHVSTAAKMWRLTLDAANIPRALMASFDMSAPFRQGLVAGAGHPIIFGRNLGHMVRAFGSESFYHAAMDEIMRRPTYQKMLDSGLALTELGPINAREEQFASNLAERLNLRELPGGEHLPGVLGSGPGDVVRASGRAYTGFLTKMRADVFDQLVPQAEQAARMAGRDPEKARADLAKFINSATGRGDLGAIRSWGPALNATLFSPKLLKSRLDFLNPVYYAKLDPFARRQAIKGFAGLLGSVGIVLELANLAGAKVNMDPRNADFAKIRLGNTRIDLLGGFQQPVRLAAQEAPGFMGGGKIISSTTGQTLRLGPSGPGHLSRLDILQRFFEAKASPQVAITEALLRQRSAVGQKVSPGSLLQQYLVPLGIQDAINQATSKGRSTPEKIGATLGSFLLSGGGVGVQQYGPKPPKGRGSGSTYAGAGSGGGSAYARAGSGGGSAYAHAGGP